MVSSILLPTFRFYLALMLKDILWVVAQTILTSIAGGRLTTVHIGRLWFPKLTIRGVEVRVGLLPIGSSVSIAGRGNGVDEGPGNWRQLSMPRRAIILFGPTLVQLIVAVLCLPLPRALSSIGHTIPQVFIHEMAPLIRGFYELLRTSSLSIVFGVICAKLTAIKALDIPMLASGLFKRFDVMPPESEAPDAQSRRVRHWGLWFFLPTFLVYLYVMGRFLWGLVHVVF